MKPQGNAVPERRTTKNGRKSPVQKSAIFAPSKRTGGLTGTKKRLPLDCATACLVSLSHTNGSRSSALVSYRSRSAHTLCCCMRTKRNQMQRRPSQRHLKLYGVFSYHSGPRGLGHMYTKHGTHHTRLHSRCCCTDGESRTDQSVQADLARSFLC